MPYLFHFKILQNIKIDSMKNKYFLSFIFFINFLIFSFNLKATPDSFADLVEELLPAVVSIASTTIVESKNNQPIPRFLKDHLLMNFSKNILIMNNQVLQNSDQ